MTAWIALLRGINVGGAKRVAMADLRAMFADLGFPDARSFIQSGNVVIPGAAPPEIEGVLEAQFVSRFGFTSTFVVRTLTHWEAVIAANPFPAQALELPSRLMVHFFKTPLPPGASESGVQHELVHLAPQEAFVFYPAGIAESKLKLPALGTSRNWNTVLKLRELAHQF